jgi:hypothetical protein
MREETLKIYDSLVSLCPRFERKGKTMPYTSANGYMFSLLNKAGELGVRLPKAYGEAFKQEHNTTKFISYGAVMKDYVLITEQMLNDADFMVNLLNKSFDYVMSLPPK